MQVIKEGAKYGATTGCIIPAILYATEKDNEALPVVATSAAAGAIGGSAMGVLSNLACSSSNKTHKILCARISGAAVGPFMLPLLVASGFAWFVSNYKD